MGEWFGRIVPTAFLLLIVFTFGTVNETWDGLLDWGLTLWYCFWFVGGIAVLALSTKLEQDKNAHENIRDHKYDAFEKGFQGWRLVSRLSTFVMHVGVLVYMDWSGMLALYITAFISMQIGTAALKGAIDTLRKEWGLEEESEDHDSYSEFE